MTTPAPAQPATPPAKAADKALKPISAFEEVKRNLMSDETKKQFEMALPPQMKPEKFLRVAITALNKTPELLTCTRQSLYQSFILAAQDGLLPDGREAAIVPFRNHGVETATYMPMVRGILKKVRNSGELKSITAKVVREHDFFKYWVDETGEHLKHEPVLSDESSKVTHAYALAQTKDGGVFIDVMTRPEIEKVRNVSKAKDAMAWSQWWDEMAKKTVIRRLSKVLPMSTDLEDVIRRDDHLFDPTAKVDGAPIELSKGGPTRLEKMLQESPGKVIDGEAKDVTDQPSTDTPSENNEAK